MGEKGTACFSTEFLLLLGIYWDKLSPEKLGQIKILRELKRKIERETGAKLPTGPSESCPPQLEGSVDALHLHHLLLPCKDRC